jgi:hypothetical protein
MPDFARHSYFFEKEVSSFCLRPTKKTFQTGANGENRGKNIAVYRPPLSRAARDSLLFNIAFILVFLFLSFFTDFAPLRLKKHYNGHSGPFLQRTNFYLGQE